MTDRILLDHGSGGKMAHQLMTGLLLPLFDNPLLAMMHDGAVFDVAEGRLAFSTDTFVVDPIFFPGGDIGDLAVNGTVNDVAMCGAVPLYLSMGLIVEEGLAMIDLKRVLISARSAMDRAGVQLITGDTKVVPRGAVDKIFINTSGIGVVAPGVRIGGDGARAGDRIILSGTMADHGIAVLTQREGLRFESDIHSDTAPLNAMVQAILAAAPAVRVLRDPTRGGVGTALNEIALKSRVGMIIEEARLPVAPAVAGLANCWALIPFIWPMRANCSAAYPTIKPTRCCPPSASHPSAERRRSSAGGSRSSRQSGDDHRHRRTADRGYAGWRAIASNMLIYRGNKKY
jgi:hydrogenase expression/formation protein HypE